MDFAMWIERVYFLADNCYHLVIFTLLLLDNRSMLKLVIKYLFPKYRIISITNAVGSRPILFNTSFHVILKCC